MGNLGRLIKVELCDTWKTEDRDFTPWLAQPENMEVLADVLDMELEVEAEEKDVGPFRADILCKDTYDGSWVLIENQLEKTDHTHLGQLLTYAAGLKAVTIVWIASSFTNEHRATLDWLNSSTEDSLRFFGLEVELWKISESPAAPKFNIVSKPNDWSRSVSKASRQIGEGNLTKTKQLQLAFWQDFAPKLKEKTTLRARKPLPQHWMNFSIGRTGFHLGATLNTQSNRLGVELEILDKKNANIYYMMLQQDKIAIENELGFSLNWKELPKKRSSRIVVFKDGADITKKEDWSTHQEWMIEALTLFNKVFRKRIKELDIGNYIENEEEIDSISKLIKDQLNK